MLIPVNLSPLSYLPVHCPLCETLKSLPFWNTNWKLLKRNKKRKNGFETRTTRPQATGAKELKLSRRCSNQLLSWGLLLIFVAATLWKWNTSCCKTTNNLSHSFCGKKH